MRILLAAKLMEMGGIERSVVSIARELQARGHSVWVVSAGGYLVRYLDRNGTPHHTAPMDITSPLAIARAARLIRRLVENEHIELVHSFSATSTVAVNLALRTLSRSGRRAVQFVSSPLGLQNSASEPELVTRARNWLLKLGAERILVISPEIRRHLKLVGAREDQLVDFNFVGLDLDAFQSAAEDYLSVRHEFGFEPDAQLVSTIGALHPRKSHELFLEAASVVLRALPGTRFLIIGDGEQRRELEQQARSNGLEGTVVFAGMRDDVPRLLSATDVYVKPGIVEGFIGLTVLEAMAVHRPVVAFDTEDVKLALTDDVTGAIVPNGNSRALGEKIVYLLRNPAVSERLGAAGQKLVNERFGFGMLAERLEEFYRGVLANPGPERAAHTG